MAWVDDFQEKLVKSSVKAMAIGFAILLFIVAYASYILNNFAWIIFLALGIFILYKVFKKKARRLSKRSFNIFLLLGIALIIVLSLNAWLPTENPFKTKTIPKEDIPEPKEPTTPIELPIDKVICGEKCEKGIYSSGNSPEHQVVSCLCIGSKSGSKHYYYSGEQLTQEEVDKMNYGT